MRRTLAWLLVLALGVGLSVYAVTLQPSGPRMDADGHVLDESLGPQRLFELTPAELAAVEIIAEGEATRFERDAEGRWFLHAHEAGASPDEAQHRHSSDAALAESLEKAFQLLANARYDRVVASGPLMDRARFGLTHPSLIAIVYRQGQAQPLLTLESGDLAPDGLGRYVLVPQLRMIVLLPDYQIANLRKLAEGGMQP